MQSSSRVDFHYVFSLKRGAEAGGEGEKVYHHSEHSETLRD